MRQIGTIPREQWARLFADYLVAKGIAAHAEPQAKEWVIWVREEDQVESSRAELQRFLSQPEDPSFRRVATEAAQVRQAKQLRRQQAAKNFVDVRQQVWQRQALRRAPLTTTLIGLSVLIFVLTGFAQNRDSLVFRALGFCDWGTPTTALTQMQDPWYGISDIAHGQIWRLVTPAFLHLDIIHVLFNMIMLSYFGVMIESRQGTLRLGVLVLITALVSNLGQYLLTRSPYFGGMSGVNYGLFGYIWLRAYFAPGDGLRVRSETVFILIVWLILGFVGALDRSDGTSIANWAHLGGLLSGAALGYALPTEWMKGRRIR